MSRVTLRYLGHRYRETDDRPSEAITFHVPDRMKGQIVTIAFGDSRCRDADAGAPWLRHTDASPEGGVSFFRRVRA